MDIRSDYFKKPNNDCKCCGGSGVQRNNNTGLIQECPCCFGSGKKRKKMGGIPYRINSR
jgi:hypothetical protein